MQAASVSTMLTAEERGMSPQNTLPCYTMIYNSATFHHVMRHISMFMELKFHIKFLTHLTMLIVIIFRYLTYKPNVMRAIFLSGVYCQCLLLCQAVFG